MSKKASFEARTFLVFSCDGEEIGVLTDERPESDLMCFYPINEIPITAEELRSIADKIEETERG